MEVRLFGPVAVQHGGLLIPIAGNRPSRLLRALALDPRRAVHADALVEAVWSKGVPANPSKALQTVVVRLRRAVGQELVVTSSGGYALGPTVTTDLERVDGDIARSSEMNDDCERLRALAAALSEWTIAPFDDLADWSHARSECARLTERRMATEDELLALRLRVEGPTTVIADLEAAVTAEPLHEQRWVLLVEALSRAGRTTEALRALDRARQIFARELGIRPGARLQMLEDDLLLPSTDTGDDPALRAARHRELAELARHDGDMSRAAKELTLALAAAREAGRPPAALVDLLIALATAYRQSGEVSKARDAVDEAAGIARLAASPRHLAQVALVGAGDAGQTTLDATASAIPLLKEALDCLPPAPTPMRAQLLARYAVAASHVERQRELERVLADAASIAAIVDDPLTTATVLIARAVVEQDPLHRNERHLRFEQLTRLAEIEHKPEWRAAALPSHARLLAQEGDIVTALELLDDLASRGEAIGDKVAAAVAGSRALLQATVTGEFEEVISAINFSARLIEPAMTDPAAASVMRWAQTGVAMLVYDRAADAPDAVMQFPRTSMDVLATAYVAAVLGSTARTEEGLAVLRRITPEALAELPRDIYWLSVLWALGRAVWALRDRERAAALQECCSSVSDLLVIDGGFFFLGAVAHHAGLGAAVAGRTNDAKELLASAVDRYKRLGSPWWAAASRAQLQTLR
jgi:DNA-binding SARP family transcriptional activator